MKEDKEIKEGSARTDLRLAKGNVKLVIRYTCEMKIRQLCEVFPRNEYSGFLFYEVKSMKPDFSEVVIEAVDFLLMGIGDSAFTTFTYRPELIKYMAANGYIGKYQYGLAHSHHTMSTSASGTDINTIRKEGSERNHFLSLIVNNSGEYSAYFTRKVKVSEKSLRKVEFNSINNEKVEYEEEVTNEYEAVEYYNMKIVKSYPKASELNARINEVRELEKKIANENKSKFTKVGALGFNTREEYVNPIGATGVRNGVFRSTSLSKQMKVKCLSIFSNALKLDPSMGIEDILDSFDGYVEFNATDKVLSMTDLSNLFPHTDDMGVKLKLGANLCNLFADYVQRNESAEIIINQISDYLNFKFIY